MTIKFNKLIIENFLSIQYAELNLNQTGYIMVSGRNENQDDNAKSNGSGKSTLWEALVWCLSGETMRGTKDVKRFSATKKEHCKVTVELNLDNNSYKIIRVKDPSNLFIFVNGEDKSGKGIRDSQGLLEEYLPGLTAQLIGSVIVMGQGLPMRFSNNSPSGRKDVLEKLSKSDFMIDDLKTKVAARKAELTNQAREFEDQILLNRTVINTKQQDIIQNKTEITNLNAINYEDLISEKTKIIDNYKIEAEKNTDLVYNLNLEVEKLNTELNSIYKNKYDEQAIVTKSYEPILNEIKEKLHAVQTNCAILNNKINSINTIKTHCPTCGQPLKGVQKPDTTTLKTELSTQTKQANDLAAELKQITIKQTDDLAAITKKYTESESQLNQQLLKLKSNLNTLNTTQVQLNRVIASTTNDINALIIQKENLAYKLDQLNSNIEVANKLIKEAEELIEKNTKALDIIKARLDIVIKFESALKRDFRGILLDNIIKYINLRAKEYSNIVFGTSKLNFELDGNNISITYCDKDYTNLSGGEKQRVDLIVQFALRDMLCKYLNFSSNILVLDEIVDNLDSIGCQKVMELISMKLNDVDSIYIISHHADIPIPADHELVVVKDKAGISYVDDQVFT